MTSAVTPLSVDDRQLPQVSEAIEKINSVFKSTGSHDDFDKLWGFPLGPNPDEEDRYPCDVYPRPQSARRRSAELVSWSVA